MSCITTGKNPRQIREPCPRTDYRCYLTDTPSMPFITKVQAKKQVLAGAMRIAPEGTAGAWYVHQDPVGNTALTIHWQAR